MLRVVGVLLRVPRLHTIQLHISQHPLAENILQNDTRTKTYKYANEHSHNVIFFIAWLKQESRLGEGYLQHTHSNDTTTQSHVFGGNFSQEHANSSLVLEKIPRRIQKMSEGVVKGHTYVRLRTYISHVRTLLKRMKKIQRQRRKKNNEMKVKEAKKKENLGKMEIQ